MYKCNLFAQREEITDEEKARALKDTYVKLVVKSRRLYLDYHESHPGFFAFVVKTGFLFGLYTDLIRFN